jgi:hypothetical protein
MSENSYTVSSSTGWFGRIGESIKGVLFGFLLIVVSFPVLFINEGRAVKTQKTLEEGASSVVAVSPDSVDSKNDGKLVYVTGEVAQPAGSISDDEFKVSAEALKLRRKVEFYQWEEEQKTETKKKLGGGEEKVTTFTYNQVWSDHPIDSSRFDKKQKYSNPEPALSEKEWVVDEMNVGAFKLSSGLVGQIGNYTAVNTPTEAGLPEEIAGKKLHKQGAGFYLGANPSSPEIGDFRVSHETVLPGPVSLIAKQTSQTFEPYIAKAGGSIEMLSTGTVSAESMFAAAHASNKLMTWGLRLLGAVLMFVGFNLLFRPLSVLADIVPLFGTIVGAGTGIIALLLSVPLSLLTISVAWIFYRPLVGVPLALAAVVGFVFLFRKLAAQKKAKLA